MADLKGACNYLECDVCCRTYNVLKTKLKKILRFLKGPLRKALPKFYNFMNILSQPHGCRIWIVRNVSSEDYKLQDCGWEQVHDVTATEQNSVTETSECRLMTLPTTVLYLELASCKIRLNHYRNIMLDIF
jgi:hypothetical protein